MTPAPGMRWQKFVGDHARFAIRDISGRPPIKGWRALLRTNLGRADLLRQEIIQAHTRGLPLAGASWRDIPMKEGASGWELDLPLAEVGFFKAKAYLVDPAGWQHWPEGPDVQVSVHPNQYRTGNVLYCAFTRMFGESRTRLSTTDEQLERQLARLDKAYYTVIPPSGKLRELAAVLPHIFQTLGCRVLHLLPVSPTPTTMARYGRFGSPYAALDLTAIDPALVVFDRRTTGVEQFRELAFQAHLLGGRIFLDIVINHTGWGSVLQENHPEWFLRGASGEFASPGAWGVTWEDLVELKHQNVALWDELADMFLTWCRRGVDGFRCDAGYKVPVAAWQYIVARVQQEYPETVFLLEGLGGAWEATEALLTEGGMQWAYSELFQNYSGPEVAAYVSHALRESERVGLLVHYSETHDNDRLAKRGRAWSLLRNRLCALASVSGGFGYTCGVEWLATEKIRVHGSTGVAWGSRENLVPELGRLSELLHEHPAFYDGATITRLSSDDSTILALLRQSEEGLDRVLVLVNTDIEQKAKLVLPSEAALKISADESKPLVDWSDLLGQKSPISKSDIGQPLTLELGAGAAYCLSPSLKPNGMHGQTYRTTRAQAAWAFGALQQVLSAEQVGMLNWKWLARVVERTPSGFLTAISQIAEELASNPESSYGQDGHPTVQVERAKLEERLNRLPNDEFYPRVVTWTLQDSRRVTLVPPEHWLLVQDTAPFRASLSFSHGGRPRNIQSIPAGTFHIGCFPPEQQAAEAQLRMERFANDQQHIEGGIRYLSQAPAIPEGIFEHPSAHNTTLLTNGRGGMARLCIDLGQVRSKYDCVLGANLHPELPVDRHIFAKRIRVWVNADGFISPLDIHNLGSFSAGPPAVWNFVALAGDARTVEISMAAAMLEGSNTTVFRFTRPTAAQASGKQLPTEADVRLTVRLDIEDRNFHWETKRNGGADFHFASNTRSLPASPDRAVNSDTNSNPAQSGAGRFIGFVFAPAQDRQMRAYANKGSYHPQPEWSENLPHPVEQSRGQVGSGDAYSPGWFELPLHKGTEVTLEVTAEASDPAPQEIQIALQSREQNPGPGAAATVNKNADAEPGGKEFAACLRQAVRAFVVRRQRGKTVIAGYPWFLDWGRDTFICARGLLSAGMVEEVHQIILTFARFEKDGTLPNTIFGEDASNRDTSDAPLWFGLVCEELESFSGSAGTVLPVLESIALNYIKGTPNGIRMDTDSGLIWSPSHFTWMDTNYPAATPREGYPVEIQALWIRLLQYLGRKAVLAQQKQRWNDLAVRARKSVEELFWLEEQGWYGDVLRARSGQPAREAQLEDALRSNCLLAVSLGLVSGGQARRCVEAARRYLVVPGALRSLAPLPVKVPLPVYGTDGRLLNDPQAPYWGQYLADEDTRRKPAYHNGTGWTWTYPVFCEALAHAWDFSPAAKRAARAYLGAMAELLGESCLGQFPELLDGDAPHTPRGCDAQAWAATEALRVWMLLN